MSPMTQCLKVASIAAIVLAAACAQTIGVAPCGDDQKDCGEQLPNDDSKRADSPPIPEGTYETVATQPLSELRPEWDLPLPTPGGGYVDDGRSSPILQTDDDGNLVYFWMQRSTRRLYVFPIGDDGTMGAKFEVPKPTAWNMYPSPEVALPCEGQVCVNERGPSVQVKWIANCGPDGSETCSKREKLFYGTDLSAPQTRRDLSAEAVQDVLRDRHSNLYVVTSGAEGSVRKLEAQTGKTEWERSDFDTDTAFDGKDYEFSLTGVPLDDGRFVVATQARELAFAGTPVVVHFIDADGSVQGGSMVFEAARSFLLNAGDRAVFVTSVMGDLVVTSMSDALHFKAVQFLRDGYTSLDAEAAAVDPSGNVYVGTHSGSRTDSTPTLCRVTVEGSGSCYALPPIVGMERREPWSFGQMVAREGGELFIRSGTRLVRLVYPE